MLVVASGESISKDSLAILAAVDLVAYVDASHGQHVRAEGRLYSNWAALTCPWAVRLHHSPSDLEVLMRVMVGMHNLLVVQEECPVAAVTGILVGALAIQAIARALSEHEELGLAA